ncbi:MAG: endo-1,4-beta-xylanase [Prevotella sp.]|nr:endo-1,4-beta-xylanase [Prevotella sp.]
MDFGTVETFVNNAEENGMTVYGHTLAWHAQQPAKWLNSLLADKPVPIDPNASNNFLKITVPNAGDVSYAWQIYYVLPTPLVKGKTYHLTMRVKSANVFKMGFWPYKDGGATQYLADPEVPTSWGTLSWDFQASDDLEQLQWAIGFLNGTICFDDIVLIEDGSEENLVANGNFDEEATSGWRKNSWHGSLTFEVGKEGAGPATYMVSLIDNGDMEGDDAKNFAKKENSGSIVYEITDGVGKDGGRGVKIASKGGQADAWESQFWIVSNEVLNAGDKVHVAFDYRADGGCVGTSVDTQAHFGPGEYQHWSCAGSPKFTDAWQTYDKVVVLDTSMAPDGKGMKSIAFNMSPNAADGNYYIDNVVLEIEKSGNSIPLTPEEKKEVLTGAMDTWIAGMMEACGGKVKGWDVVNEAISGGNPDGEGVYALQHGDDGGEHAATDFFWQDYLGDLDYVRTAVRLAREYGPEDIQLFINDYNLESDWDQNGKLKSLIKWIERWEADGVTKIDGIGTQMHISCYANPATQESKKKAIENMFRLMAATGKLVRVSELDMGYVNAEGASLKTTELTQEQHKEMAELYKFVIEKYLEIIPANQQYGITQWCITDSQENSGWRGGEPVGLWDLNFNRKHAYAGFADGLAGK